MRYFELFNDMRVPGRWVLGDPLDEHGQEIDPWLFGEGRPLDSPGPLQLLQARPGRALDFSLTTLAVPVVHGRVASLLARLGLQQQVQLFPIRVEREAEPYFVLNALRVIRCIDEARCEEVQHYTPEDGQPEKVGEYRVVAGLRIDPSQPDGAHIFRPWGWPVVLLVSEHLKQAMEQEGITGTRFTEV